MNCLQFIQRLQVFQWVKKIEGYEYPSIYAVRLQYGMLVAYLDQRSVVVADRQMLVVG